MEWARRMQKKLRALQRTDLKTKKRWFFVASSVSMAAIVGLWILYLNLTLPTLETSATVSSTPTQAATENSVSDTFARGFGNIRDEFSTQWQTLKETVQKNFSNLKQGLTQENQFSIEQGTSTQFLPEPVAPIPETRLP